MNITPELGFFNTGETAIHYASWPASPGATGPAVLFIHGITGRYQTWEQVSEAIRNGNRAIAVDLRGHGRSGRTTGKYRLPDYARDMAALIDGLKLGPLNVVGHSLGAMTALWLAASRPDLAVSITLEDPPLFARKIMEEIDPNRHARFGHNARLASAGMSLAELVATQRKISPDAPEADIQRFALSMHLTDPDAIWHVYDQRIDWSQEIEPTMRSVHCPVFLMQGNYELGAWMLPEDGERGRSLMKNCVLGYWEDTGHGLHGDRPDRFIEQAGAFVAKHSAVAAK
jgi:pimeloyl-ACP methyl ester carboxylesterase